MGSFEKYSIMSCIHPIFHLRSNPSPPRSRGCDTPGQAVDSSAIEKDAGIGLMHDAVQIFDEFDRFEVLAPAVLVGDPLPLLPGVVEIQHRCDGIDPQSVDVVFLQPE